MAVTVNPDVLAWARGTAGLSVADAAKKVGLKDSKELSAEQKLRLLEDGGFISVPTITRSHGENVSSPASDLLFAKSPKRGNRGEDFRNLPDRSSAAEPLIDALVRDVRAKTPTY